MVIVAAVDRSKRAPAVLDRAATLADQFGESLHVVHVMTRSEAIDTETTGISKDEGVEISESCAVAPGVVTDLLEDHPVSVETTEIGRIGDPADEIIEYAEGHEVRDIVVGPRRRSQTGKITSTRTRRGRRLSSTIPRSVSTKLSTRWNCPHSRNTRSRIEKN